MKHLWSNNKDKIILSEEGKIDENLERVPKNDACRKFMSVLKFIIVFQIILLLGWSCVTFYKYKFNNLPNSEKTQTEHSMNALENNLKFNSESNNIKSHELLSESKKQIVKNQDPILLSSLDSIKPVKIETSYDDNDLKKAKQKNEVNTEKNNDNLKSETTQEISNDENNSSNGVTFKKLFFFRILLRPKNESENYQENQNSQAVPEDPSGDRFHIRILFNPLNLEEKDDSIVDPFLHPRSVFPPSIFGNNNEESLQFPLPILQDNKPLNQWDSTSEFSSREVKNSNSEPLGKEDHDFEDFSEILKNLLNIGSKKDLPSNAFEEKNSLSSQDFRKEDSESSDKENHENENTFSKLLSQIILNPNHHEENASERDEISIMNLGSLFPPNIFDDNSEESSESPVPKSAAI